MFLSYAVMDLPVEPSRVTMGAASLQVTDRDLGRCFGLCLQLVQDFY